MRRLDGAERVSYGPGGSREPASLRLTRRGAPSRRSPCCEDSKTRGGPVPTLFRTEAEYLEYLGA